MTFIPFTPQVKHQDLTKTIILLEVELVDPRLLQRRDMLDTYDLMTAEQQAEARALLAEIETSLSREPADVEAEAAEWHDEMQTRESVNPRIVNGTSSPAWFAVQKEQEF